MPSVPTHIPRPLAGFAVLACIMFAGLAILAGCATGPAANAPPPTIDDYTLEANLAGRLGCALYLTRREHLTPAARESARLGYLALQALTHQHAVDGNGAPDIRNLIAAELAAAIPDPTYRPLVQEFAGLILRRLESRIPLDTLAPNDAWPILAAVSEGVADVLTAHGIDPAVPIPAD